MKSRWMLVPALALTLASGSLFAQDEPGPACPAATCPAGGKMKQGSEGRGGERWKELNLNDQQKSDLKVLQKEMMTALKPQMEKVRELREAIKNEFLGDAPSESKLKALAGQLTQLQAVIEAGRIDHMLKVKKLLTKEQFAKIIVEQDNCGGSQGKMGAGKRSGREGPRHPGCN